MIRFNTTTSQYEGYGGTAWQGLGGVIDIDKDTYISAENNPTDDNDELKFYTSGTQRMIIDSDGNTSIIGDLDLSGNINLSKTEDVLIKNEQHAIIVSTEGKFLVHLDNNNNNSDTGDNAHFAVTNSSDTTIFKVQEDGDTTISGDLTIQGTTSITGNVTMSGDSDVNNWYVAGNNTIIHILFTKT